MLAHPTVSKLHAMRLPGMAQALNDQIRMQDCGMLPFEDRLGLLIDREETERSNRQLAARLKRARLRQSAEAEDIDFRHPRGLDKALMLALVSCQWIRRHDNCIVTGPTGVGKTYIACALAHRACRDGLSVAYTRTDRLLRELMIARADGTYLRRLTALARLDLLVLDDWGLAPLTEESRRDLLELLDDRYDKRATLVASQMPVENWYDAIGDPTLADAILDRLVHNAHRIDLKGESMRRHRQTAPPNNEVQ